MYQFVGVPMKIREIAKLLEADVLCGEELLDGEVHSACGCDMMSDVLAFVKEQAVLLTGLCNPQVVRTAEMMDMRCIVFVRGKMPSADIVALAEESGIVVLASNERMYVACGKLYCNGLSGGSVLNAR
jgi:predicted transcriptional regulator